MKTKNNSKNNMATISLRILIMVVFITLLLTQYVFAEDSRFTIQVPDGYQFLEDEEGDLKLTVLRNDGKVTFNIQSVDTDSSTDYSQEGLNEFIESVSKETRYEIQSATGKIGTLNKYPCYDINYISISPEDDLKIYLRQIYILEEKYSYIITIGAASEELLSSDEINKAMSTFTIKDHKSEESLDSENEKMSNKTIVTLIMIGIVVIASVATVIVKTKEKHKDSDKTIKVEVSIKEDNKENPDNKPAEDNDTK